MPAGEYRLRAIDDAQQQRRQQPSPRPSGCSPENATIRQPNFQSSNTESSRRCTARTAGSGPAAASAASRPAHTTARNNGRNKYSRNTSGVSRVKAACVGNSPCGGCRLDVRPQQRAEQAPPTGWQTTRRCTASAAWVPRSRNPRSDRAHGRRASKQPPPQPATRTASHQHRPRRSADHGQRHRGRPRRGDRGFAPAPPAAAPGWRPAARRAANGAARRDQPRRPRPTASSRPAWPAPTSRPRCASALRGSPRNTQPKALVKQAAARPPIRARPPTTSTHSGAHASPPVRAGAGDPGQHAQVDQQLADKTVQRRQPRDRAGPDQERGARHRHPSAAVRPAGRCRGCRCCAGRHRRPGTAGS